MKRFIFLLGFLLLFSQAYPVQACAGLVSFEDTMRASDSFVKGRIISVDDTGGNGILEVETYYAGSGAEFLIIFENSIGEINHGTYDQCGWGLSTLAPSYPLGTNFYFALAASDISGIYRSVRIFHFADESTTIELGFPRADDRYSLEYREFNESEFLALVAEYQGENVTVPETGNIPLASALRIKTESGREYLLPPDGSNPIELTPEIFVNSLNPNLPHDGLREGHLDSYVFSYSDEDICSRDISCFVFSPDFVHLRRRFYDDGIEQLFLYSPTSEMIATWEDDVIVLYTETSWEEYQRFSLQASPFAHPDYAAWSPDGRFLAFSDARGLWLWELEGEATLLLPSDGETIPFAKRFSPLGNYLAIQEGESTEYLHLHTMEGLPDGLFSADESRLLAYNTEAESDSPLENCLVATMECETVDLLYESMEATILGHPVWLGDEEFLVNLCLEPTDNWGCRVVMLPENTTYGLHVEIGGNHRLLAYQEGTELLAILDGDSLIDIRKLEFGRMRQMMQVDVSSIIDSPITAIEWMPSFFYYVD